MHSSWYRHWQTSKIMPPRKGNRRPPTAIQRYPSARKIPTHVNWILGQSLVRVSMDIDATRSTWTPVTLRMPSKHQVESNCDRCPGFVHSSSNSLCSAKIGSPTFFSEPNVLYDFKTGKAVGTILLSNVVRKKKKRIGSAFAKLLFFK